jgi:hypothetical protein
MKEGSPSLSARGDRDFISGERCRVKGPNREKIFKLRPIFNKLATSRKMKVSEGLGNHSKI